MAAPSELEVEVKRLAHVQRHLRERPRLRHRPWMLGPELAELVEPLVSAKTIQEIADDLGPGWTWRLIEYRFGLICEEFGIPPSRQHLQRISLLRLVAGLDPCYCEDVRNEAA